MDIAWSDLISAFALVFVIEGVLPFLSPERARAVFQRISGMEDKTLRIFGFSSMAFGLTILTIFR